MKFDLSAPPKSLLPFVNSKQATFFYSIHSGPQTPVVRARSVWVLQVLDEGMEAGEFSIEYFIMPPLQWRDRLPESIDVHSVPVKLCCF